MFKAIKSPYLVSFDGGFKVGKSPTSPQSKDLSKNNCNARLAEQVEALSDLQRRLYAQNRYALLLIFQAMDAAGKDGTIRAVMSGIDPAGCQVYSFKAPSTEELDHDFLWRTALRLPERGRIGIFNRSYYEEVLVVRVHPEFLDAQHLPKSKDRKIWEERYDSIRDHERHLARNGTVILKFWLNVSKDEQRRRFISRIDELEKNWKFSSRDIEERQYWDAYMQAYENALNATSRAWAPWYAIPADDKNFMRMTVAEIIVERLRSLDIEYPELPKEERGRLLEMREVLEKEQ
jgi:PPK2 family polyphosphate:nucleotide phosphotransferase